MTKSRRTRKVTADEFEAFKALQLQGYNANRAAQMLGRSHTTLYVAYESQDYEDYLAKTSRTTQAQSTPANTLDSTIDQRDVDLKKLALIEATADYMEQIILNLAELEDRLSKLKQSMGTVKSQLELVK